MKNYSRYRPLIFAGIVLGFGLAGLLDGILFRQILQWHHMLSDAGYPDTTVSGLEVNMLADGIVAVLMWLLTVTGIVVLWRASHTQRTVWPGRMLAGMMLTGAGLYFLVEGFVDHYLLGLHHVKPGPGEGFWDILFLLIGAGLAISGIVLAVSARRSSRIEKPPTPRADQAMPANVPRHEPTTRLPPRH